ncbi:cytochrome c [Novosphingobium sp. RL4]|uniref:c-type cytochrome n=1 Tax=Novosphingobium sp. RL4 TaxID=3109595 RepID=UPI002D76547A|nr:cytochrome c [Novosphingobium sp. RL4]WRT94957.1 cytochrome c [Novosphingobium sp. RL4]
MRKALPPLLALSLLAGCGGTKDGASAGAAAKGPPPMPPPVTLASRPDAGPGERLFIEKCAMCHGPVGMGTGLLARRVDEPALEKRKDLSADFVVQAARIGIGNMPAIPRGEVSDEQMGLIAGYLAKGDANGGKAQ